jgi:hypothetical protein
VTKYIILRHLGDVFIHLGAARPGKKYFYFSAIIKNNGLIPDPTALRAFPGVSPGWGYVL